MKLLAWISEFRRSLSQKQQDRSPGDRTVVVSRVRPDAGAAVHWMPAAPLHHQPPVEPDRHWQPGLASVRRVADVPGEVQERIERENLLRTIRRLETPLRGLNAVTARRSMSCSAEEMYRLFLLWRQALGDYLSLTADERTVLTYGPGVDEAYFVRGARAPGAQLAVLEPCWTLNGVVALRGEAQVIEVGG